MMTLPWRILVVTEAGADARADADTSAGADPKVRPDAAGVDAAPYRIDATGVDGWLGALGASVVVPLGPGRSAALALDRLAAFEPEAIAATLGSPADLDAVLHHPALQRLESAARGIELLLRHAQGAVEVQVLSAPRKALVSRFREAVFDPLVDGSPSDWPSLVLADLDFSHKAEDLIPLRELASLARVLQAPIVGHASPAFFDFRHLSHALALPDHAARLTDPAHASWREFQSSDEARWVALTLNRFLQRAPYEREAMGYTESTDEGKPETFLWGRGVWLVGAAAARSVKSFGHAMDLSGRGGLFQDLPTRPYPIAVNDKALLATEVPIPDQKALELSRAAFTPVVGKLRAPVAVLTSAVTVFRWQPARLTTEGTLAYQILAGRLAQFCTLLLESMPAGDAAQSAEFLRSELTGFLGSLAVPAVAGTGAAEPDGSISGAVTVEVRTEEVEGGTRTLAEVAVRPVAPIEGKPIDFRFVLPLRG